MLSKSEEYKFFHFTLLSLKQIITNTANIKLSSHHPPELCQTSKLRLPTLILNI